MVARCLPDKVGELVVLYLAYVRCFVNLIYSRTSPIPNAYDGNYLFCDISDPTKPWTGREITPILRRATEKHLGVSLGLSEYRQFVVAVTTKFLQKLAGYFGFKIPSDWIDKYKQYVVPIFANQAAQSTEARDGNYGNDADQEPSFRLDILEQYEVASRIWIAWLEFEDEQRQDVEVEVERMQDIEVEDEQMQDIEVEGQNDDEQMEDVSGNETVESVEEGRSIPKKRKRSEEVTRAGDDDVPMTPAKRFKTVEVCPTDTPRSRKLVERLNETGTKLKEVWESFKVDYGAWEKQVEFLDRHREGRREMAKMLG